MLKSLFESSIDRLHIPAGMKSAIKNISNICLEAEDSKKDKDEDKDKEKDKGKKSGGSREPSSGSDGHSKTGGEAAANESNAKKKEAQKNYVNQQYHYEAYPQTQQGQPAQTDNGPMVFRDNANAQPAAQPQAAKGATREPNQARTAGPASGEASAVAAQNATQQQQQGNAAPSQPQQAAPQYRRGADVATVQLFLKASHPESGIVADGVLGPKTISLIQSTEDLKQTGKMDNDTQTAFNLLLNEAKGKVKAVQAQLGVQQDGLVGKATLAALNNAHMNPTSIFNGQAAPERNAAQPTNTGAPQGGNNGSAQVNVLELSFNPTTAQHALQSRQISQQEYDIWKNYNIAPVYQRRNPQQTQAQIAKMQQNGQPQVAKGATRAPNQVRTSGTQANPTAVAQGTQQAPQQQTAQQPQQPAQQQPQQQTAQQQQQQQPQQPAQQQPQQPQQTAQQQQAANQGAQPAPQGGKAMYQSLPPDEKKVYGEAYKKAVADYLRQGNNEETAKNKAHMNAGAAVVRYRQRNGGNQRQQAAAPNNNGQVVHKVTQTPQGTTEYMSGNVSRMNLPPDEEKVYDDVYDKTFKQNVKLVEEKKMRQDRAEPAASEAARQAVIRYRAQKNKTKGA